MADLVVVEAEGVEARAKHATRNEPDVVVAEVELLQLSKAEDGAGLEAGQVGVSLEDCLCQIDYLKIICRLYQKSYNNILKENISDSIVYNLRNLHWKLWTSEVSFSFKPRTYDTPFSWTLTYHIDIICAEKNKSFFPWDFLNDYMCNSIT